MPFARSDMHPSCEADDTSMSPTPKLSPGTADDSIREIHNLISNLEAKMLEKLKMEREQRQSELAEWTASVLVDRCCDAIESWHSEQASHLRAIDIEEILKSLDIGKEVAKAVESEREERLREIQDVREKCDAITSNMEEFLSTTSGLVDRCCAPIERCQREQADLAKQLSRLKEDVKAVKTSPEERKVLTKAVELVKQEREARQSEVNEVREKCKSLDASLENLVATMTSELENKLSPLIVRLDGFESNIVGEMIEERAWHVKDMNGMRNDMNRRVEELKTAIEDVSQLKIVLDDASQTCSTAETAPSAEGTPPQPESATTKGGSANMPPQPESAAVQQPGGLEHKTPRASDGGPAASQPSKSPRGSEASGPVGNRSDRVMGCSGANSAADTASASVRATLFLEKPLPVARAMSTAKLPIAAVVYNLETADREAEEQQRRPRRTESARAILTGNRGIPLRENQFSPQNYQQQPLSQRGGLRRAP
eukprot:gnl/TRDRNA2_/TRDRNA2_151457_c0_seq5.p1 gnl/TRDRNA2_/TRDRNA2_151457_c0~~gnl/TRDRNA2_/TRDRNA2_151457_c0_seq5.p1  ORF type:complete len:503 (+),score=111.07 gnl/TRDRNA2_/TRDRNA2_151457_c0_seq5:56-1510(+)